MSKINTQPTVNLLREEVESWRPFFDALRAEDRMIARDLVERCWRFASVIQSSKKRYLVEPLLLTILLIQEERIKWSESELKRLREEIDAWKQKAGY